MIITISGTPGSGKSTVAKILVERLKAERIYVGGIRRQLARDKGMTLNELNEYAKEHPETDVDVDKKSAAEAKQLDHDGKTVIVEGRTQFHFLPKSIKVFMTVSMDEGAKRIWKDLQDQEASSQRNEGSYASIEELIKGLKQREENDAQRYLKYYGFDHRDKKNYDFVIDTTNLTPEEVVGKIVEFVQKHK